MKKRIIRDSIMVKLKRCFENHRDAFIEDKLNECLFLLKFKDSSVWIDYSFGIKGIDFIINL